MHKSLVLFEQRQTGGQLAGPLCACALSCSSSNIESGSDNGSRGQEVSGGLAEGAPGHAHALPLGARAPATQCGRRSKQPSLRFAAANRKALGRLVKRTHKFLGRADQIANSQFHVALLMVDVSRAEGCCKVVGDPKLVAHFNQPSERASLQAALATSSSDGRTVCTAESAAAAKLSHLQKQAYCAKQIAFFFS